MHIVLSTKSEKPQTVNNDLIQTCSFAFLDAKWSIGTLRTLIEGNSFIIARCENWSLVLISVFCESWKNVYATWFEFLNFQHMFCLSSHAEENHPNIVTSWFLPTSQ